MKKAAIAIIVVGLALTLFTALTVFTKEKVVEIGDVKISRNKPHHLSWSPLIGVGVMAFGGILLLVPPKK
jgi:hypothetical protein